jgi:cbb3-type cytochrome oxidase subunit 3
VAKALDESKLRSRQRNASIALYIVGGLTLLLGLTAELGQVQVLLQLFGSGWVVAVEGLILVVLGYFTMRGSLLALGIALGIYGIDAILTIVGGALQGIWLRALVLFFLIQGFIALRELKRRQRAAASPASPSPTATASDALPTQERPHTS